MFIKMFLEGCPKNWQQCFLLKSPKKRAEIFPCACPFFLCGNMAKSYVRLGCGCLVFTTCRVESPTLKPKIGWWLSTIESFGLCTSYESDPGKKTEVLSSDNPACPGFCFVLFSFFLNLTQLACLERGTSIEKKCFHQTAYRQVCGGVFLICDGHG